MPAATSLRKQDTIEHPAPKAQTEAHAREHWMSAFRRVRSETEARAAHLSPEDQVVQSMPDASPTKWHRAHVTWFFETFLLSPYAPGYKIYDERFPFLFNSYYVAARCENSVLKKEIHCQKSARFIP